MKKINQIISENKERKARLNQDYDPLTGQGSPLERKPLQLSGAARVQLPLPMFDEPLVQQIQQEGSLEAAAASIEMDPEDYRKAFTDCRLAHDFEFWCAACAKIENTMGELVPFILNPPQRKSLKSLEDMRVAQLPVRELELKHRQYGSTTMKNAYACWIQNVVKMGYRAYLCSLDSDGSKEIMRRYEVIGDNYPAEVGQIRLKPYRGARNTFQVVGRNGLLNIGSAERPNAPSGRSVQIVLISEAGKMKSTAAKGADKLITNMMSMVQEEPDTFVMVESTAEASGMWFRQEVYKARNGESGFHLTFINWITDPRCQKEVEDQAAFIRTFEEYDWFLWGEGASLEQIHWYREKEKLYPNPWQMKQENPTTIEEAFQGSGRRVYRPSYVQNARKTCREPYVVGNLYADGEKGKAALKNIQFEVEDQGNLKIWKMPNDPDPGFPMRRRYCVFVDVGGRTEKADWSVLTVIDRYWMMYGGAPERAATWRGHIDQDLFAWIAARVAKWYNNALLAIEVNSLRRDGDTEGEHHLTILDEIKDYYPYLYTRTDPEKVREGMPAKYGFHTNRASKTLIVNTLNGALRDETYVERDYLAADEMDSFEFKDDGSMGAKEGMHDDVLITTAGGVWLATEHMKPPAEDKTGEEYKKYGKRQYSEAML